MSHLAASFRRKAIAGLAAGLLVACAFPPDADRAPRRGSDRAVAPDSGVVRDPQGEAHWTSVVERGRVSEIVERVALYGALTGERTYRFDTLGALRQLAEHIGGSTGPAHVSVVEFRAGVPALATRAIDGAPAPFARKEMLRLEARGYALFDSAHHAVPR